MAGGADEDPGRGAARDRAVTNANGAVTDADDTRSSGDSAARGGVGWRPPLAEGARRPQARLVGEIMSRIVRHADLLFLNLVSVCSTIPRHETRRHHPGPAGCCSLWDAGPARSAKPAPHTSNGSVRR